ncbi:protein phosphatase 2C domain-containing protein [Candidatus Poriferisodalis sp.]|uniref:protein phosphatase 2C domain-containing protein n=1 Tax=Candidatus Poriferisodalis sp. TaxID=3101277 RepID=UPI003B52D04A
MTIEGRHLSGGAVSAEWLSELGPRDENQDHARIRLHYDSSWLIAVADGLGGHPRGRAAARAAIKSLPHRIDTPDEMSAAFKAAHEAVFELAPKHLRCSRSGGRRCPASTLCVTAWTPSGGLVVGIAGDTRAVVLWRDGEAAWHGRTLGHLHRNISVYGYITKYLG